MRYYCYIFFHFIDSQIRSENIGNLEEKQKLLQISQHSSVFGKILTESSNANIGSNAEVKKREKVFEFQDVTSEISEVSFQIRKRNESHISHFSPLLLNKPLKNEVGFF